MSTTLPAGPAAFGNRPLFRFLFVAAAMYLAWFFGYEQWLAHDGRLDHLLCTNITQASVGALRLLQFPAAVAPPPAPDFLVMMDGQPAVVVGVPCNGLALYALFTGFVLAFPGPGRRKLWFIPAGILLIWCLNVVRVAALAINHHYAHQSVDFNHHYTFTFLVYGCVFGLWTLWARRLSDPAQPVFSPASVAVAVGA